MEKLEIGNAVLNEFQAVEIIVIGAPMYNFSIPSQLKAWIDLLAVPGVASRYSSADPEDLLGGHRVIIVSSRGGAYGRGSPFEAGDFQEKYLKHVFGFLELRRSRSCGRKVRLETLKS